LTVIASLTDISDLSDLDQWADAFGTTHTLVGDADKALWNAYVDTGGRPQYVVFDREMTIQFKGKGSSGHKDAEAVVLELLK
jgi:hypothetical protein